MPEYYLFGLLTGIMICSLGNWGKKSSLQHYKVKSECMYSMIRDHEMFIEHRGLKEEFDMYKKTKEDKLNEIDEMNHVIDNVIDNLINKAMKDLANDK